MKDLKKLKIEDYPVSITVRVRFRDLDPNMHLNNSVYLNLFEEARIAYMKLVPAVQEYTKQHGILKALTDLIPSMVVRTSIEFRGQALLHQKIIVCARIASIKKSFIDFEYGVYEKESGSLLALGESRLMTIDPDTMKPRTLGPEFHDAVKKLEDRE